MDMFMLISMMAITVEALIEYTKTVAKAISQKEYKTAGTQITAIVISIFLCFAANANLYAVLGVTFSYPWIGIVLTGIFASRGANFVSDIVKKMQGSLK
jgi:protein-S-isoprenylcysteine O-methyltransferase Ste14